MRILMLGWDYPPNAQGALGEACAGLCEALLKRDVEILLVLPRLTEGESLASSEKLVMKDVTSMLADQTEASDFSDPHELRTVPAFLKPYWDEQDFSQAAEGFKPGQSSKVDRRYYGPNVFEEVAYFTSRISEAIQGEEFDIIHAHEWMTFPAGMALSRLHKKALVSHLHVFERDREDSERSDRIASIESLGLRDAARVIVTSQYAKKVLVEEDKYAEEDVSVVHNGSYRSEAIDFHGGRRKQVMFSPRLSYQEPPFSLVRAAKLLLEKEPDTRFVVTGTGQVIQELEALSEELGVAKAFEFPGFAQAADFERYHASSLLYVSGAEEDLFADRSAEYIDCSLPILTARSEQSSGQFEEYEAKNPHELAVKMAELLSSAELRERCLDQQSEAIQRGRWELSATKLERIYRRLIQGS